MLKAMTDKLSANKKHNGFTLIELIMVVVILGILAAFALPKFASLDDEARTAAFDSMRGAIHSAAKMAQLQQQAQGLGPDDSIIVDGETITMTGGFPTDESIGLLVDVGGFIETTGGWFKWEPIDHHSCMVDYNAVGHHSSINFKVRFHVSGC